MIAVTRLDGTTLILNVDLIESIAPTPDTVICLANGHKVMVLEPPDEIVTRVVQWKRRIGSPESAQAAGGDRA
jgi:flagellar protein FlbD